MAETFAQVGVRVRGGSALVRIDQREAVLLEPEAAAAYAQVILDACTDAMHEDRAARRG